MVSSILARFHSMTELSPRARRSPDPETEMTGRWNPGSTTWLEARACPFAHRAIIARRLLGLESAVSLGMCGPTHDWKSWTFNLYPDSVDPVLGVGRLRDCYLRRRSPSCGHLRGRSSRPETHCGRGGHGSAHERQEPNHEQEDPLRRFSPRRRRGEHRTALSAPWRSHPTHELFT